MTRLRWWLAIAALALGTAAAIDGAVTARRHSAVPLVRPHSGC